MQNSISYWQHVLLQETEEKELSPKQQKIAKLDPPADKIDADDFAKLRAGAKIEEDGQDHEVSMANNSLETIIKHAMDLKSKLGSEEKDIPAWIQDHITNAANFISQAAENYHEYGEEDHEDADADAGGEEKTDDEIEDETMMEDIEFISLEDFANNLKRYKNGDILKSQLINAFNRLESEDQQKAEQMAKDLDVLLAPRPVKETDTDSMSLESMMEDLLEAKKPKKWIQKAIHPSKEGSLKKALGVKKDETIPAGKLAAAAKKGGKLGQRARLAQTLKKLNK